MKKFNIFFIGILIIIIGVWYYLHAFTNVFQKNFLYYCYYDNVKGLQVSSPIYLKGVRVGLVEDIFINDNRKVETIFAINKNLKIPNGTIAIVTSGDLTGSKSVVLLLGKEKGYINSGGELIAGVDSTMIEHFNAQVTPILHHGKVLLKIADSGLLSFNGFILETFAQESQSSVASLDNNIESITQTSVNAKHRVDRLMPTINNFSKTVSALKDKNESLNKSISNGDKSISKLNKVDFKNHFNDFQSSTQKLSNTFKDFNKSKLVTRKKGYENAQHSLDTLHQSLVDYQKDPPALINILGKEKKK